MSHLFSNSFASLLGRAAGQGENRALALSHREAIAAQTDVRSSAARSLGKRATCAQRGYADTEPDQTRTEQNRIDPSHCHDLLAGTRLSIT